MAAATAAAAPAESECERILFGAGWFDVGCVVSRPSFRLFASARCGRGRRGFGRVFLRQQTPAHSCRVDIIFYDLARARCQACPRSRAPHARTQLDCRSTAVQRRARRCMPACCPGNRELIFKCIHILYVVRRDGCWLAWCCGRWAAAAAADGWSFSSSSPSSTSSGNGSVCTRSGPFFLFSGRP